MKIGIIGTGNMAHFLVKRLAETAFPVTHLYARNPDKAVQLAQGFAVEIVDDINTIESIVDVLFIAVSDDAIPAITNFLEGKDSCKYIHCSGTKGLDIFPLKLKNTGIFWPIYSIHKHNLPTGRDMPIVLTSSNQNVIGVMEQIAAELTNIYAYFPPEKKEILHALAVMTNNFITHLVHVAADVAAASQVDFHWMHAIIRQTVANILTQHDIGALQTGPAIRGDKSTIAQHEALLHQYPLTLELYKNITQSIINYNRLNHDDEK